VAHSLDVLTRLSPTVPPELVERAEQWGAGGTAVEPRRSASVILLRETHAGLGTYGLETYLLHRHARMAFAASMVVFPGGGVDEADRSSGDDPVLVCARRETEEETGVRLAEGDLQPWAHWITPEFEPRRYDTFFFVAGMPSGQQARDISGETDFAAWTRPAEALSAHQSGTIALMPPTLSILVELAEAGSLDAVREAAVGRIIEPVLPRLVRSDQGWRFDYPSNPRGASQ
jgi:8-oxo-dGTP pyrophosphatase MutT (NUDIX family)